MLTLYVNIFYEKNKVKEDIPAWEACVAEGFNGSLAFSLCNGKSKMLRGGHSMLHECLRNMAKATARMGVTPEIKEQPMTAASIAVALQLLPQASVAVVVCQGIELIKKHKQTAVGPSMAETFLKQFKHDAAYATIPAVFWQEFEQWSDLEDVSQKEAPASDGHNTESLVMDSCNNHYQ